MFPKKPVFKNPCAGNRSLNIRLPKIIFCIRPSEKPSPENHIHILRNHILPRCTHPVVWVPAFWTRFCGYGLLGPRFVDTVPKTISRKPGPKRPYPQNVPGTTGPIKPDPRRVWCLVGGFLDYDFLCGLRISGHGFWDSVFELQILEHGFLPSRLLDRVLRIRFWR